MKRALRDKRRTMEGQPLEKVFADFEAMQPTEGERRTRKPAKSDNTFCRHKKPEGCGHSCEKNSHSHNGSREKVDRSRERMSGCECKPCP